MIPVTKTYLPPLEEYVEKLRTIWSTGQLTNNGPLLRELEEKLKDLLGVKHLLITANGTLALQIAIKAVGLKKKIITTPFSYVATVGSILWEQCEPVFVDINEKDFCINADLIENAITPDVEAILAVHVYGYPCDILKLDEIARKYNLRVIYDAAHAFGSKLDGRELAGYGDISALSFHATKLFHMVEGGAIATDNDEIARKARLYRAFGHVRDEHYSEGINAKNSEFHSAMGLCLLPKLDEFIESRKKVSELYDKLLPWDKLGRPNSDCANFKYNYGYYPVVFANENQALNLKIKLESNDIFPRRYFYPSLNTLPYIHNWADACPTSSSVANRVLCLPLFYGLEHNDVERIAGIIAKVIK